MASNGSDRSFVSDVVSPQPRDALEKLKLASALIGMTIKHELAGSNDQDVLERLYCAKGGVACAIEETKKHFGE